MNNVYQIVTDRIIAELEKGVIPWRKPWTGHSLRRVQPQHRKAVQPAQSNTPRQARRVHHLFTDQGRRRHDPQG